MSLPTSVVANVMPVATRLFPLTLDIEPDLYGVEIMRNPL